VREAHGAYRLTLRDLRWTEDLAISGTVEFPRYQGAAHASLRVRGGKDFDGTLEAHWQEGVSLARAQIHGALGGRALAAEMSAP